MIFKSPANDVLSVGEFTRRLKGLVEDAFPAVWVRGEISNMRAQPSGHIYFTLKDAQSQLSAVLFRGDALRLRAPLRDGMQVLAFGTVSVYEPRGNYQLIVRVIEEDGVGRLRRDFEALKRKLAGEGLFAPELKRALPVLPESVGFVTSPAGAAIQDFIKILRRRNWRGRVVVLPARVQGAEAAPEIAAMIERANRLGIFDLLVVGRGGGSLEDLWPFNEEIVVRAVRASNVPVISAVGHEIDFTLCDFAADVRAETPSAAAELISSGFLDCVGRLEDAGGTLKKTVLRKYENLSQRLDLSASRLAHHKPERAIERLRLRLENAGSRLRGAAALFSERKKQKLFVIENQLHRSSPATRANALSEKLNSLEARLKSLSVETTLQRGFALVRDAGDGEIVKSSGVVLSVKKLKLKFAAGVAGVAGE